MQCFDGDGFFGPKKVRDSKALRGMLKGYDRRAGIDKDTWLRQYSGVKDVCITPFAPMWPSGGHLVNRTFNYSNYVRERGSSFGPTMPAVGTQSTRMADPLKRKGQYLRARLSIASVKKTTQRTLHPSEHHLQPVPSQPICSSCHTMHTK